MKGINKNIAVSLCAIVIVGLSLLILLQKLPRLISHTVYYCQSSMFSLLTPVPHQLFLLPFLLLALVVVLALAKLLFAVAKAQILKRTLIKNRYTDGRVDKLLKKLQIADITFLIISDKPFAFCLGLINPKIYISTALLRLLSLKELEVILHHELYHLKNRDTLTMVIVTLGKALLPFLPVISDFLTNYRIERELNADNEAVKRTGDKYLLISILKKLLMNPSPPIVHAPAILDGDTFEPRIAAITKNNAAAFRTYKFNNILISLFSVGVIAFALVGPVHAMHIHSQNNHIIMLHPTEDECLVWSEDLNIHP